MIHKWHTAIVKPKAASSALRSARWANVSFSMGMMFALLVMLCLCVSTAGAATIEGELESLRERFRERHSQVQQALQKQEIGETWQGLVLVVKPPLPAALQELVNQENKDRTRLYEVMAQDDKSVTTAMVAQQNALRNLESRGDRNLLFRDQLDQWRQREDWVRYLLIERAKPLAQLGETADGMVALVPDSLRPTTISEDQRDLLNRLVETENQYRTGIYQQKAKTQDHPVAKVAREAGARNLANALPGHAVRQANGTWGQLPLPKG
jgi:uncharacterized protein YdbL (DUF1318 family)